MARSQTDRNGKYERPTWRHTSTRGRIPFMEVSFASLEMLESCRNVLEQIADSQMLQCSVAGDIRKMRIALEKIDRRLAKERPLR